MLRRIPRTALTAALITALLGAPVLAGPVARNDQEYALLGRVFPEVADSLTYIQYTNEFVPAIQYLESRYPSRLKVFTYGTSVEGRGLYAVELTDENSRSRTRTATSSPSTSRSTPASARRPREP